jgi:Spy/CpxP family protein refolding chaperone
MPQAYTTRQRAETPLPGRMHHFIRWLWLVTLSMLAGAAGCATSVMSVPSAEVERLLELPPSTTGITSEQSTALRSLLETSESNRKTLALHLAEESHHLKQEMAKEGLLESPEVRAQAALVSRLRTEQLLMAAQFRDRVWEILTPEQRIWLVRHRSKVILPQ